MNAKTFRLFIALLISIVAYPTPSRSEELDATKKKSSFSGKTAETPEKVFRGIFLSADVFGYIYPIFVQDKFYSAEISASVNLKNRFFPVLEAGIGHTNIVSQLYEIGYRTRAPYYRIGMDYNMQYKNGKSNYIYLGGRIGYTSFDYNVDAPALKDPVWGGEVPMQLTGMPCRAIWAEAVAGVRAEITGNLYMGWSLRYKYPLHKAPISNGGPWYIPGFGAGSSTVLGATYTITYYFNFKNRL